MLDASRSTGPLSRSPAMPHPIVRILPLALLVPALALLRPGGDRPFGPDRRPEARPYLGLPLDESTPPPATLSAAGVFTDTRALTPISDLIPYDLIVPFWSDGAEKTRWIAVPRGRIRSAPAGEWSFPEGTVFVKHFALGVTRLETRILLRGPNGAVRGFSYRWRADASDADLIREGRVETLRRPINGLTRWAFPGPTDCRQCHTPASGGILGVKPRQIDREMRYPSGIVDDQLRTWSHLGLIDPPPKGGARLARADDRTAPLEARARSYLDANCAHCHRPGGAAADFDARFVTPLAEQGLIGAPARINLGIDSAKQVAPNDPWRSMVLARLATLEPTKMPPLAHERLDPEGLALLREWIASLPGPPVVPPPTIRPGGGDFRGSVRVRIEHPDPSATIRYTLDGSPPGKTAPVYVGPFDLKSSTTVRARGYREGSMRSVIVQETFILP